MAVFKGAVNMECLLSIGGVLRKKIISWGEWDILKHVIISKCVQAEIIEVNVRFF